MSVHPKALSGHCGWRQDCLGLQGEEAVFLVKKEDIGSLRGLNILSAPQPHVTWPKLGMVYDPFFAGRWLPRPVPACTSPGVCPTAYASPLLSGAGLLGQHDACPGMEPYSTQWWPGAAPLAVFNSTWWLWRLLALTSLTGRSCFRGRLVPLLTLVENLAL